MKKTFLIAIIANLISIGLFAQNGEAKTITPPNNVKLAFNKTFIGTSRVKWEKEGNDFEVNFVQQKKELSAVFDSKGTLKETEEAIAVTSLPAAATSYISKHYNGAKIKDAAKITKAGGEINYEAEVNKTDVVFDAKGNFLKVDND